MTFTKDGYITLIENYILNDDTSKTFHMFSNNDPLPEGYTYINYNVRNILNQPVMSRITLDDGRSFITGKTGNTLINVTTNTDYVVYITANGYDSAYDTFNINEYTIRTIYLSTDDIVYNESMPYTGINPLLQQYYDNFNQTSQLMNESLMDSYNHTFYPLIQIEYYNGRVADMANNTSAFIHAYNIVYSTLFMPVLAGLPLIFKAYGVWKLTLFLILQAVGK
jgi:hypothetical protein